MLRAEAATGGGRPSRGGPPQPRHPAMTDSKSQVDSETKALKKELENTRSALKVQVARCRNLVAAFTRKLAEKDAEMRACKDLRDKQLSGVLRALIVLEARLRREQKSIRAQLAEKDNLINSQLVEIERLKEERSYREQERASPSIKEHSAAETVLEKEPPEHQESAFITECYAKPDLITSLGIDGEKRPEEDSPTPSLTVYERSPHDYEISCPPDSLSSDTASTRSCLGDTGSDSDFPSHHSSSPQMKGILSVHNRSAFSPINKSFQKHAVENKNLYVQELSKNNNNKTEYDAHEVKTSYFHGVEEELDNRPEDPCVRNVKHLPSALLQEVRIGTRIGDQDEYQDNPVLQCVNQILLKDQEDFLEEQRSLRIRGLDVNRMDHDANDHSSWGTAECEDDEETQASDKKHKRSPSPGKKAALHHQEKACLTMSNRLSIARMNEYDQTEMHQSNKHATDCKKSGSLADLSKGKFVARSNPPLPPKPNRLSGIKRVEFAMDKRRDIKPTTVEFHNPPMVLLPPQPVRIDTTEIDIINKQPSLPMSILDPMDQGPDNELYVISNSALDDDIVQHLQGRTVNGSGLDIGLNSQLLGNDNVGIHTRTQHSNVPNGLLHPNHKPKNKGMTNNINLFSTANGLFNNHLSPSKDNNNGNGILKTSRQSGNKGGKAAFKTPPKATIANAIKVASPVATLLTSGKAQEAPGRGKAEVSPSVSQMVRRFEDLGTKKEEGQGDDSFAAESEAANGDKDTSGGEGGGEAPVTVSYDNFLEATGLSQKSIMTPSRMLSNHKSVMKPKDVKHRSKVKAANISDKCHPAAVGVGPTIKYWTEPYL